MKYKSLVILLALILIPSLVLASQVPTRYGFNLLPGTTFDNDTAFVNVTGAWLTPSLGRLDDVNATIFNSNSGTLTIDESWLTAFGGGEWLRLDGGNSPTASINWDGFNINNIGNATITDTVFLGESDHWIRKGVIGFTGLSENAIAIQHSEALSAGTITFIVTSNVTNKDNDIISIMAQAGLNNSGGYLGNSWMIAPNDLTTNLTKLSNCFFVINATGNSPRVFCDTSDTGADLFVQDDIQLGGTLFGGDGIEVEGPAVFDLHGNNANFNNGTVHIAIPVTFEQGFTSGDPVTKFTETFQGGIGIFTNLQEDLGDWINILSSVFCDEGECAIGDGAGVGLVEMQTNFSTADVNETTLSFVYSLVNFIGAADFSIEVNNNVGSGDIEIFSDTTTSVIKEPEVIALPSSMDDQPLITLTVICNIGSSGKPTRQCYFDTAKLNGTAITTTRINVSSFNSVIAFRDGLLAADGFPERGIIYNASSDTIIFRGNTSIQNLIEQDLNVTNSIEINGTTIFDWAGVINSAVWPEYFLANGSTTMTGSANIGGLDVYNAFNVNATNGNFGNAQIGSINISGVALTSLTDIELSCGDDCRFFAVDQLTGTATNGKVEFISTNADVILQAGTDVLVNGTDDVRITASDDAKLISRNNGIEINAAVIVDVIAGTSIHLQQDTNVSGILTALGIPTSIAFDGASLIVNPATSIANYLLQSWSVGGIIKASIDEDGDFTTLGTMAWGGGSSTATDAHIIDASNPHGTTLQQSTLRITNDLDFFGTGSGMLYGSIFINSSQTINIVSIGSFVKITGWNAGRSNLMTVAGDEVIPLKRGEYLISYTVSAQGEQNEDEFEVVIFVDDTRCVEGRSRGYVDDTNIPRIFSGTAICDVSDPFDEIDLRVTNHDATADFIVKLASLNALQVGG